MEVLTSTEMNGDRNIPNLKDMIRDLFNFRGRGSRKEWWLTHLLLLSVPLGLFFLLDQLGIDQSNSRAATLMFLSLGCFIFPLSSSVSIRRLHDAGYSAWYYLLAFIPYIGGICLLILVCIEAETGANKYGEPVT